MLILVSTWLVQPALYALLPPKLAPLPAAASAGAIEPGRMPFRGSVAVILVAGALATAAFGIGSGYELPFDYDVLSLLPKDSESAYYQNRMVAESDYQAEVVIFTAPDLEEARRIAAEAGRLGSVAKVQSLMDLFPPDADARALEARRIGELADDGYAVRLARLAAIGLPEGTFGRVRTILEKGGDFIDQSQELAFSAGHSGLVAALEDVRGGWMQSGPPSRPIPSRPGSAASGSSGCCCRRRSGAWHCWRSGARHGPSPRPNFRRLCGTGFRRRRDGCSVRFSGKNCV